VQWEEPHVARGGNRTQIGIYFVIVELRVEKRLNDTEELTAKKVDRMLASHSLATKLTTSTRIKFIKYNNSNNIINTLQYVLLHSSNDYFDFFPRRDKKPTPLDFSSDSLSFGGLLDFEDFLWGLSD
jgi:hypothetical protein